MAEDCIVEVTGGELGEEEIAAYKKHTLEKYGEMPEKLEIKVDGGDVELSAHFGHHQFDRIRRITGYLVGTLDRFNDAKRHEEHDRVKHGVGCGCADCK